MRKFRQVIKGFVTFLALLSMLIQSATPYFYVVPQAAHAQEAQVTPTDAPSDTPTVTPDQSQTVTPSVSPTDALTPTDDSTTPTIAPTDTPTVTPDQNQVDNNSPPSNNQNSSNNNSSTPTVTPTATATPTTTPVQNSKEEGIIAVSVLDNTAAPSIDLAAANTQGSATLTTDKADYSPTDTALITGNGFNAGETYTLIITSSDQPPVDFETQVTADQNGSFTYAYQLDGNYRPNYKVQVRDSSGNIVATTTFTDSSAVTVATGGSAISADTNSNNGTGAYTALTGPVITEGVVGDVSTGTIILSAPSGFAFDTGTNVTLTATATGSCSNSGANHITDLGTGSGVATETVTPTATTITNNVKHASKGTSGCASVLTYTNIKVRPTNAGSTLSSGNITSSGTATINGVTGSTNFGTLTEVVGAKNKLAFTTQPSATATTNTDFATKPVVTLQDQFGNTVTSDNASTITRTAVLSTQACGGTAGSGTLTSTPASGTAVASGVMTYSAMQYSAAESIKICATSTGVTSALSSTVAVSAPPDLIAPTTTDNVDSNWHNTDVTVTLTCTDNVGGSGCANTYHTTDGSTPTTSSSTTNPFTLTSDGNYTIKYFSKDVAGNSESVKTAANTVKIDKTNPVDPTVSSSSHTVSTWSNNNTIAVSWSGATDALSGVAGYSYLFDTSPATAPDHVSEGAGTSTTSSPLANGNSYYFHLATKDNAGNWTSTVHFGPFFIDTTAPTVSADNASASWRTSNITITLSTSDAGGSGLNNVRYRWDSPATSSTGTVFTDGTTINITSEGNHTLYLYADDNAGNSNTSSGSYKLDTSDPSVSATGASASWQNSVPTITVSASDAVSGVASVKYAWDAPASGGTATSDGADLTSTYPGDGNHTLNLLVTDNAGRTNNFSGTYKVDTGNPTDPTSVTSSSHTTSTWSNDNTVDVSWSGATDALSGVAGYSFLWDTNSSTAPDHISEGSATSITSPALSDGNSNYFHLSTTDLAGNWTSTVHFGPFFIDTVAPSTPVATPPAGDYTSDQSVALSSSDTGGSGVASIYYTTDGSTPDNSKTLYVGAITVDHDMTIKAIAYDNAGNASGILSATYGIAPVISGEAFARGSDVSLTVNWLTDDLSTSRVIYDTAPHAVLGSAPNYGYANSTVEDPTKVTSHSVTISGLATSVTYYYRTVSHGSPETVGSEQIYTINYVYGVGGGDGKSDGGSTGGGGGGGTSTQTSGVLGAATGGSAGGDILGVETQLAPTEEVTPTITPASGKAVLGEKTPQEKQPKVASGFLRKNGWIILVILAITFSALWFLKQSKGKK